MVLTKEHKDEFFKRYDCGDISALAYLDSLIQNSKEDEELKELSSCVCFLNYMNDIIETRSWEHFQRFDNEIVDLYFAMKIELLDTVGITQQDWHDYCGY